MSETMQIGLHRQTLSAQIYETLEAKILAGDLRPGTRLSEESLAERFGVSRAPVREALASLQRAGLAEKSGARDRMVAIPNAALIAQKYDLWWVVDVGRTYLASLEATPEECDALASLITAMDAAVTAGDAATYRDLVARFHEDIRAACRNPYISEIAAGCDIHLRWFEALYDRHAEICAVAVQEHARILAAFRARDFTALSDSIRTHMLRQRDNILRLFEASPYPHVIAAAAD
jgi:DNA-binding GntR family transcriptional regulator